MAAPLSVSGLTALIRGALQSRPELEDVLVEGELSNLSTPASGHLYFTLKDSQAAIGCVVWRSNRLLIPFRPEHGMGVIAHGHIEVYDQQGRYQLYVDRLEPSGVGALALAVEQRKKALAAEGLFDERLKRPLPLLPRRVVVVTSRTGAALRDVLTVMRRRGPCVDVVLSPATVQGDGAVETLLTALERAQDVRDAGVVLLVRGGGSLEDLMAFNDERLARAIRASRLPVVTGVGHETDTTIADLAADRRAPTPSAAAELAVPDARALRGELLARRGRLSQAARRELELKRGTLVALQARLGGHSPARRIPGHRQELDARAARLRGALLTLVGVKRRARDLSASRLQAVSPAQRVAVEWSGLGDRKRRLERVLLERNREAVSALEARRLRLEALSPLRTLERGYSITMDAQTGAVVSDPSATAPGRRLRTRVAGGEMISVVEETRGAGPSTGGGEQMYDSGHGAGGGAT